MNVLFVCTLNRARSVAAERLYRKTPGLSVRSGGTDDRAAHQVTEQDLAWADRIIVFEAGHAAWLRSTFAGEIPEIIDLGIPDEFAADDPQLMVELRESLETVLGEPGHRRGR